MNRLSQISENLNEVNLLDKYRQTSTIDLQDFKEVIFGPNWHWRERGFKYILKHLDKHPHFHLEQATRKQQRLQSSKLIWFYATNRQLTNEEYEQDHNILTLFSNALYSYSPGFCVKNGVHIILYLKTIVTLGTQRHQSWINRAYQHNDIGCFALTEALHGTNVKGLMTEAHYDHSKKEFIIHSPNRDAMKFWIGAAANLATVAVVWAQLYIGETCHGVHVFIVPLRNQKNHDLLPGILIGDCGPKNGVNQVDNGFIMFNKVRVPVANLLNRLSGVDSDGKYYNKCRNQEARFGLQLGAISGGRISISMSAPTTALNALSIALRYTCTRRQFAPPNSKQEVFLYNYPLTKFRMMPLLAQAIVYQQVGCEMSRLWDKHYKLLLQPDNKMVDEMHSISSVLKAKASWFASDVICECRQMMGGHGFSSYSRLNNMYHDNDINQTWEGDNTVLLQQGMKFVLEAAQSMTKGEPIEVANLKFLAEPPEIPATITKEQLTNVDFLEQVFQVRVSEKLQQTGMRLLELKNKKMPTFDIWNNAQVHYGQILALNYGDLVYLQTAKAALRLFKSTENRKVFADCIILWALRCLSKSDFGTNQIQDTIRLIMEEKCQELSNQAISLLDFMAAPSIILGSCFADEKGQGMQIYTNLIFSAKDTFKKVEWYRLLTERNRNDSK